MHGITWGALRESGAGRPGSRPRSHARVNAPMVNESLIPAGKDLLSGLA
jgi:hypothetical protein